MGRRKVENGERNDKKNVEEEFKTNKGEVEAKKKASRKIKMREEEEKEMKRM